MSIVMKLKKAVAKKITELNQPVITNYQLALALHRLYRKKSIGREPIASITKEFASSRELSKIQNSMLDEGILNHYRGLATKYVFSILGRKDAQPSEIACSVDPFCYVSHLSAMDYHGLTNRIPGKLFISSPGKNLWKEFALERMKKDLGEDLDIYLSNGLPRLAKIKMEKIGKTVVHRQNSIHLGAYRNVQKMTLRVSTVGRTFLDMLKAPDLCGGMAHVLEVFSEYAEKYQRLITDEVTSHGSQIDKVRAGYLLEELLGLDSPCFHDWVSYAQRGGSRKLDPSGEYLPEFSDKWKLSINVGNLG